MKKRFPLFIGLVCPVLAGLLICTCISCSRSGTYKSNVLELTIKDVKYTFRWCPPEKFQMGEEREPHQVTLSKGFYLLETEVTQDMWESIMDNNPSEFKGVKLPVETVSWDDCQEYIKKLNDTIARSDSKGFPAGYIP